MSAGSVIAAARPEDHRAGGGATPTSALQQLLVKPVPFVVARKLLEREHYLHSFPGGTKLAFGAFVITRLLGALTLGAGPSYAYSLVDGATPDDCLTLSRPKVIWAPFTRPPAGSTSAGPRPCPGTTSATARPDTPEV